MTATLAAMKHLLPAIAIVALLILPQAAWAQINQLAKVNEIHVSVTDGVKDGCLPSPNTLKVEAELVLRRSPRLFDVSITRIEPH